MRQLAQTYYSIELPAQAVPQSPWEHIVLLLQKIKDPEEGEGYARQILEDEDYFIDMFLSFEISFIYCCGNFMF